MKRIVIVVGMNRSGTSLLAQALERLGVSFGAPLIEGDKANVRGYYEHRDIVHHQTLLMQMCCDRRGFSDIGPLRVTDIDKAEVHEKAMRDILNREMDTWELFGVKTTWWPRMPEQWWSLIDEWEPVFFHAMRSPDAVYDSIIRANGTEAKRSAKTWRQFVKTWAWHNAELLELEPTEVWYEEWREDADAVMKRLADALGKETVSTEGLLL